MRKRACAGGGERASERRRLCAFPSLFFSFVLDGHYCPSLPFGSQRSGSTAPATARVPLRVKNVEEGARFGSPGERGWQREIASASFTTKQSKLAEERNQCNLSFSLSTALTDDDDGLGALGAGLGGHGGDSLGDGDGFFGHSGVWGGLARGRAVKRGRKEKVDGE